MRNSAKTTYATRIFPIRQQSLPDFCPGSGCTSATGLTGVVAIAGTPGEGYALKSDGTVWSWGGNVQGELGNGTTGTNCSDGQGVSPNGPNCASAVPVQVSGLTGVTRIGGQLAVKSDGTVWRWGPRGSTPRQDNAPVQVPNLTDVTAFAQTPSGDSTYYALRSGGRHGVGVGRQHLEGSLRKRHDVRDEFVLRD